MTLVVLCTAALTSKREETVSSTACRETAVSWATKTLTKSSSWYLLNIRTGREGRRKGGSEGGREGVREGVREGGSEGVREGGME